MVDVPDWSTIHCGTYYPVNDYDYQIQWIEPDKFSPEQGEQGLNRSIFDLNEIEGFFGEDESTHEKEDIREVIGSHGNFGV